jgi:hypothetical protein
MGGATVRPVGGRHWLPGLGVTQTKYDGQFDQLNAPGTPGIQAQPQNR